jgi:16S rRNA G966 N2-methylase RsmD
VAEDTFGLWAARKAFKHLREFGPRETADLIRKNVSALVRHYLNRRFDKRFHVDTSGVVQLSNLTCDSGNKEHGVWYEPTPIKTLKWIFSLLQSDVSNVTFIDFGSGKGRTILYASNYNFRRIIEVEFARELHDVAERNIRAYASRTQKCFAISSVCLDAVKFVLPEEECVLYFFHPFREEVMARVLDNIDESYRQKPRKVIILYYHPQVNDVIRRYPFLRKREIRTMPFDLSAEPCPYRRRLEIYET